LGLAWALPEIDWMPEKRLPPATTCLVLSDGKAGDEIQCLAIAEGLGLTPQIRHVAPRPPWVWAMPWGPIDPGEGPDRSGSPIAPPYPDIVIASGRRTVPYLRAIKRASRRRTFTVFLKDPRTGTGAADLIWVPQHDPLRGDNVITSLTSPHRVSADRLAATAAALPEAIARLARPRVALLLGGDSRHHRFTATDIDVLTSRVAQLARDGATLMATPSRRTPAPLIGALRELVESSGGFFWDGTGENPYLAMLAGSDAVVVTADSVNMVGEAVATGRPVLLYEPAWSGRPNRRIERFIGALFEHGAVRSFQGRLESYAYKPLESTQDIVAAVVAAYHRHLGSLGCSGR
jgi:uncharacterized protein